MRNLLSAECFRLRKSRLFWAVLFAYILLSVSIIWDNAQAQRNGYEVYLEDIYFQFAILLGFFLAGFLPLHIGVDYSDGSLRNKCIAGHSRASIYLSVLSAAIFSSLILCVATIAVNSLLGLSLLGGFQLEAPQLIMMLLASLLLCLAYSSQHVMLSMLISNRAVCAVTSLVLVIAMSLLVGKLDSMLRQAEIARDMIALVDGKPVFSDPYPNPLYVSGLKRTIYEFLYDFFPIGQGAQLSNLEAERLTRFPALSLLFTLLTTGVGLLAFSRKDIK